MVTSPSQRKSPNEAGREEHGEYEVNESEGKRVATKDPVIGNQLDKNSSLDWRGHNLLIMTPNLGFAGDGNV